MTDTLVNGQVFRPSPGPGPGMMDDEPVMAYMQLWPSMKPTSLLSLMMAFSTYAASKCSVREERMEQAYKMVRNGYYIQDRLVGEDAL